MEKNKVSREARRRHIIENAAIVFGEHGYDGARTRWIADACGMNEALIYRYFPSKEEMFIEAVKYIHEKAVESWDAIIADSPNSLEAIRRIFLSRINRVFFNPRMASNILHGSVASAKTDAMRELSNKWFSTAQETITGLIFKGIAEGIIRADQNPETVSYWIRSFSYFVNVMIVEGLQDKLGMEKAICILDEYIDSISTPEGLQQKVQYRIMPAEMFLTGAGHPGGVPSAGKTDLAGNVGHRIQD